MLAITGLFCCAVAVGIGAGFNAVRESTDKKIIAVAEKVKENYPNISEKELAQILHNNPARPPRAPAPPAPPPARG